MKRLKLATLFLQKHLNISKCLKVGTWESLVNWCYRNLQHLGYQVIPLLPKKRFQRNQTPTSPSYFFPSDTTEADRSASITPHDMLEQSTEFFLPQNKAKCPSPSHKSFKYAWNAGRSTVCATGYWCSICHDTVIYGSFCSAMAMNQYT